MDNDSLFKYMNKSYTDSDLGIDYEKIQNILISLLKFKPRIINYKENYSEEEVLDITYNFFEFLGPKYLDFYKTIISSGRVIIDKNIKSGHNNGMITVNLEGTLKDVYILIHELMHDFELKTDNNITNNFLSEIVSITFEKILFHYLKTIGCNGLDILSFEKERCNNTYNGVVNSLYEIMIINVKKTHGKLSLESIKEYIKQHPCDIWNNISDYELLSNLNDLKDDNKTYLYNLRYVIGQLVSVKLIDNYKDNLQLADVLIDFIKLDIKDNNIKNRLKILNISVDNISSLIQEYEKYYKNISVRIKEELEKIIC